MSDTTTSSPDLPSQCHPKVHLFLYVLEDAFDALFVKNGERYFRRVVIDDRNNEKFKVYGIRKGWWGQNKYYLLATTHLIMDKISLSKMAHFNKLNIESYGYAVSFQNLVSRLRANYLPQNFPITLHFNSDEPIPQDIAWIEDYVLNK
jgi:hypothetical protein